MPKPATLWAHVTARRILDAAVEACERDGDAAWTANGLGSAPGQDFGTFVATWENPRLVMTSPEDNNPLRVVFSDFTPDSFLWTSEYSQDGGETWLAVTRVRATRYR